MRYAVLAFLAFGSWLDGADAKEQRSANTDGRKLEIGERVRVSTSDDDRVSGRIEELTADLLRIEVVGESRFLSVPLVEVTKIEVSQGRRSRARGAWTKAKWGALLGAVPGAVSLGVQHEQVGENGSSVPEAVALGAFSGGLFGGLLGAAIGAIRPGETWERVSPTLQIGPAARGDFSFSFALTVGF